jgi:serine protease Do
MVALSALVAAGCGGAWTRERPPERALDRILPSSVQIVLEQQEGRRFRSGSGVVIGARRAGGGADCFILTSGHTFAGAGRGKDIYVLSRRHEGPGVRTPATLLAVSETDGIDLALLGTRSQDCSVASFGKPAHLGESVWVVSFPWGRELTVSRGVISQVRRAVVGASLAGGAGAAGRLMVDAPVSYGASGGGVFRASSGELVGLVDGYPTARVAFEGVSAPAHIDVPVPGQTYLTPIGDAVEFLRGSGHALLVAKGTAAPG